MGGGKGRDSEMGGDLEGKLDWVYGLVGESVFPAIIPDVGLALLPISEIFVPVVQSTVQLPQSRGLPQSLVELFKGQVPLLDVPDPGEFFRVKRLLGSFFFEGRVRWLEDWVERVTSKGQMRIPDSVASQRYTKCLPFIKRYVFVFSFGSCSNRVSKAGVWTWR